MVAPATEETKLVRARPDLRAKIDELFDNEIKNNVSLKNTTNLSTSDYYFDSYSHYGIHEEMLQDEIRTKAYEFAIMRNRTLFKDKVVLDVGCGTGVLSIFAVKAGAKHVYAIDKANIHHKTTEIVKLNHMSDQITVINAKVEEVTLPVDKVDIIISEWMGYALLYEAMFDSVIYARDKWLKKGGHLFPDKAVMYLTGLDDREYYRERLDFWNNVYGFRMTSFKKWIEFEALVEVVPKNSICTDHCKVFELDLNTCTVQDLDFSSHYVLQAKKDTYVNGYALWFDTLFSLGEKNITLSTSIVPS